jgi:hypothetical protein
MKKKQKSSRNSNAKGMPKRKTKKPSQGGFALNQYT